MATTSDTPMDIVDRTSRQIRDCGRDVVKLMRIFSACDNAQPALLGFVV